MAVAIPSSRMTDHNLRFSDVAQFVGLSLLRDPSATRSKAKRASSHSASADHSSSSTTARELPSSSHTQSAPSLPSVSKSLPSISSERADQLKIQLGYLQVERQLEQEHLTKLESRLSGSMLAERKLQQKITKERERRDFHKERAQQQEDLIRTLQAELRAGEQAALQAQELIRSSSQQFEPAVSQKARVSAQPVQRTRPVPQPKVIRVAEAARDEGDKASGLVKRATSERASDDDKVALSQPAATADRQDAVSAGHLPIRHRAASASSKDDGRPVADQNMEAVGERSPQSPSKRSVCSEPAGTLQEVDSEPRFTTMPDLSSFESEEELANYRRDAIRNELVRKAGSELQAFTAINLNGSGRICSQEFADGVARFGVRWQVLTGLRKPRDLFKLFSSHPRSGVITLYELFPSEYNKPRDDSGLTTPDFWKTYVRENQNMDQGCRGPKWQPAGPDEELERLFGVRKKNEYADFKHKWISTTFRRMKARGKTDARCREMVALHLPRGTGPADRQEVKTFSQHDVKHCRRVYQDAVLEPQRKILKNLYSLREHRRVLTHSRHQLFNVAMEPFLRQKAAEEAKKFASDSLGGLSLGLSLGGKKKEKESSEASEHDFSPSHSPSAAHVAEVHEQASFTELATMTGMDVYMIEDVFKIWMQHADRTETINKRHFQRLLEQLCPKRTFPESDLTAWWDAIHGRNDATRLTVNWKATDPAHDDGGSTPLEVGTDGVPRGMKQVRKTPASFDQFIIWWASSEVRGG